MTNWSESVFLAEPVRPIDPAAWISHTTALTGPYPHYGTAETKSPLSPPAVIYNIITHVRSHVSEFDDLPLSVSKTDMATIVKVMQLPDSGLEIRDRMWLKITIANAVIGKKCWAVCSFDKSWFHLYPKSFIVTVSMLFLTTQLSAETKWKEGMTSCVLTEY